MSDEDSTRSAGRGGLAVAGAKIYFILLGLVQQVALPRVLGLDGYGAFMRVLSLSGIAYNPITSMSIQAMSRTVVHARPEELAATVRRVLVWQALFGAVVGALFMAGAPVIARLAGASHVQGPLRILGVILFVYAVYTPLIGVANGQKRFFVQAGFDVTSATLRTLGLVMGAFVARRLGQSGPAGSAIGFVISATLVLLIAASAIGVGRAGLARLTFASYAWLAAPLLFGQGLLNLLFQADSILLGRFSTEVAVATGAPLARADALVGAYRLTQMFSFLPYQILLAITFVLFPMLASAAKTGDRDAIARYVRTGMRLSLVIAGAMVSVTAGLAPRLLRLGFGEQAAALGGRALTLLSLGFAAFAIFGILTTVLNSLGRERESFWVTAGAVVIVAVLCFTRARGGPLSEELLWLTAQATSAGLLTATLIAAWLVYRAAGALVSPWSVLRTIFALGASALLARWLSPPGNLMTLVAAALTPCFYLVLLVLMRELGPADLEMLRKVVKR